MADAGESFKLFLFGWLDVFNHPAVISKDPTARAIDVARAFVVLTLRSISTRTVEFTHGGNTNRYRGVSDPCDFEAFHLD